MELDSLYLNKYVFFGHIIEFMLLGEIIDNVEKLQCVFKMIVQGGVQSR